MKFDKIKILHLEDDKLDFEHISGILNKELNNIKIIWVYNKENFNKSLKKDEFDIILADYKIPGFTGLEALEITRKTRPEIPFVFVSGAIGEDKAIEALKAGAKDYVVKNGYKRLIPAIKRAIDEAKEITKRKEAEKALKESEKRLKMIFDTSPIGIITLNKDGDFFEVNKSFLEMLLNTREELLEMNYRQIVNDNNFNYENFIKELFEKETLTLDIEFIKKDSSILPASVTAWVIYDSKSSNYKIAAVIKDLTEHKELENQKRIHDVMVNQLERVTSLSHLSSAITHEIKQPLQSIKVIADSILYLNSKNKQLTYEEILEDTANISERVDRINNIINSIKALINTPDKLDIKSINIVKQINEAIKLYREKLKAHKIKLLFEYEANDIFALASELQLQQVMINLIENSITALNKVEREDKKIIIDILIEDDLVIIKLSDNGTGIGDNFKNKIFDAFFSLSNKTERMGMGLFIVSNIVKCFNAIISVEDNEYSGATFVIKLKKNLKKD
jgi:PAS domain S-box-containing protein